jgi:hypothetical protein
MEHTIAALPHDHQGGEITGGAEIKTSIALVALAMALSLALLRAAKPIDIEALIG